MALILCRFYWAVNVGALSPLITVNVEAHVSFWAAYLIPLVYVCLNVLSSLYTVR
jgi:POT family proton-dependent oligopeptide transporter